MEDSFYQWWILNSSPGNSEGGKGCYRILRIGVSDTEPGLLAIEMVI